MFSKKGNRIRTHQDAVENEPPTKITKRTSTNNQQINSPCTSLDGNEEVVHSVCCITRDNTRIHVPYNSMLVFESYKNDQHAVTNSEYYIDVRENVFRKMLDFIEKTKGKFLFKNIFLDQPIPELEKNAQQQWFQFSPYETKFFNDLSIPELCEILEAANQLYAKRLYIYGCQNAASRIRGKTPDQIRNEWTFKQ